MRTDDDVNVSYTTAAEQREISVYTAMCVPLSYKEINRTSK